ncbi:hypothetical protein DL767_007901 [Monosporascus sp. MG133]|nr:hypothetical protein DL767_007901 [Monosporascus sp. MG133]
MSRSVLIFAVSLILAAGRSPSHLARAQEGEDIQLYIPERLDVALGEACIDALAANIDCHSYVQTFTELRYRQSLQNVTLTDEICAADCSRSLRSWFNSVSTSCAGKTVNNGIPTKYGGYMWAGWNETCVKDPRTKQYCNDIMYDFTAVSDISEMPREELCHTCHIRRLALMQSSQYSTYNEFWKEQLEYVYAACGRSGPTEIPEPLKTTQPVPAPYCVTGKRYTTQEGDTCESIANATSVSAAALYMGNQAILPDCREVEPGVRLCLPMTCQTYYLRPSDTCVGIEVALGLDFGSVRNYNSWLDALCTNLHTATDFYGKITCVSPQGGTSSGTVPAPAPTAIPGTNDGYTHNAVAPPDGVPVAEGTTLNCGRWHEVVGEDTCSTICVQNGITTSLFHTVNPSLRPDTSCTLSLHPGTALCVGPTYNWNTTVPVTSTILGTEIMSSTSVADDAPTVFLS